MVHQRIVAPGATACKARELLEALTSVCGVVLLEVPRASRWVTSSSATSPAKTPAS